MAGVSMEMSAHAPTSLSVLQGITSRRSINIARAKPVVCVCATILLKLKNPKICHIQAMLSLLLIHNFKGRGKALHNPRPPTEII